MLKESKDTTLEYQRLSKEEMETRGILGRLVGVCADFFSPTRNGRKYPEKLWENVFADPIMKERIENGVCYGELGHPADREETDMEKIALCLAEVPKKGSDGKLRAVFDILNTPNGRILKSLCDYGSTIGISSRGSGDLETDFDGNESVNPDTYNCEGFDAVLIPAVKEARLQYVTESLNKTRYNKTLRDKLTESINKEDEKHQKIMRESLNTFGIRLDEANFGFHNYRYEIHTYKTPDADVIRGGSDTLDEAVKIACHQIDDIKQNSFEDKEDKIHMIENMYIYDSEDNEEIDTNKLEDYKDAVISELSGIVESLTNEYKGYGIQTTSYGTTIWKNGKKVITVSTDDEAKEWIDDNSQVVTESVEEELTEMSVVDTPTQVMAAYQNANKWLDSVKEFLYIEMSCPFFSSYVHSLAHSMPERFDKFGDILHTDNIQIPYPTTVELETELTSISDAFEVIFMSLDNIKQSLNDFIKDVDDIKHGMACSAETLLNDIESEYPMLFRLKDKWEQCNEDSVEFDKYVQQYIDHKDDLLESLHRGAFVTIKPDNRLGRIVNRRGDIYEVETIDGDDKNIPDRIDFYFESDLTLNENMKLNLDSNAKFNINSEDNSGEVVNDESLVEELQKALRLNKKLDEKIVALQEKLSVGYAKEMKLTEQIEGYKSRIIKLSKSTNEVRALNEKLNTVTKTKETIDNKCGLLTESLNKKNSTINTLNESITKQNKVINDLNTKLLESNKQVNATNEELSLLTEQYETLNKDMNQMKESYSNKLDKQIALVEKYKNIAIKSVDKYIETQATRLGVHTAEIKNRLPESYSFKDIDSICEDLQSYKLNMSNLPFSTTSLRESVGIKASNVSQKTLVPMEEDIDELTLRLAGFVK